MKPRENQDISKVQFATVIGGSIEPISKLAAERPEQRAERFPFTEDHRALLARVLSLDADPAGEDPA